MIVRHYNIKCPAYGPSMHSSNTEPQVLGVVCNVRGKGFSRVSTTRFTRDTYTDTRYFLINQ